MRELTEQNFKKSIWKEKTPILVEFYAVWCGSCSMMEDAFGQLEEEMEGEIRLARVDIEKNPLLAAEYRIGALPSFLLFDRGKLVLRMMGVLSEEEMKIRIQNVLHGRK